MVDLSKDENSDTFASLKKVYQDLGKCLYFDIGLETHIVFYELLNTKINWVWYISQPEPLLKVIDYFTTYDPNVYICIISMIL